MVRVRPTMSTKSMKMEKQLPMSQSPTVVNPKTNHVSTVLLYDIPIVSLYIEGQERLCLAQISNTLLKQFSYNEIHNRRVALGITCVQCTPVQLEILRRAGAMPVSSRRCGMITRREAERLCKSFLGDNAPPRLPDDFAFSVHHKCAWGCRGSFLPARYNSSRAKCIKCTYCGLFFSPNKFIFHSHRISAGDKYIQPDAANFNSWRRHMLLSGHPPEEIVHAWEDVKAMFNGGTRKRIMSSSTSGVVVTSQKLLDDPSCPAHAIVESGSGSGVVEKRCQKLSPKRVKDNGIGPVTAPATVVGVTAVATAVAQQMPIRPFNILHPVAAVNSPTSAASLPASNEIAIMPFSRSFMMDYMWHAHAVQSAAHLQQQQQKQNSAVTGPNTSNSSTLFDGGSCESLLFPIGQASEPQSSSPSYGTLQRHNADSPATTTAGSNMKSVNVFREPIASLPQLLKTSAFTPVIRENRTVAGIAAEAPIFASTSSSSSSSSSPNCSATERLRHKSNHCLGKSSSASLVRMLPPPPLPQPLMPLQPFALSLPTESENHGEVATKSQRQYAEASLYTAAAHFIKESHSSDEEDEEEPLDPELEAEDEEMVDIETTEDDPEPRRFNKFESDNSPNDIDVDGDDDVEGNSDVHHEAQNAGIGLAVAANRTYEFEEPELEHPDGSCYSLGERGADPASEVVRLHESGGESASVKGDLDSSSSSIEIVENFKASEEIMFRGIIKKETHTLYNLDKSTMIVTAQKGLLEFGQSAEERALRLKLCQSPNFKTIKFSSETSAIERERHNMMVEYQKSATTTVSQHTPTEMSMKAPAATGTVLLEALTYCNKTEMGYAASNNKNIHSNNNNSITVNNNNVDNNDFWHVARLSLQHPGHFDLSNVTQPLRQQQHPLHLSQLYRHHLQEQRVMPPQSESIPLAHSHSYIENHVAPDFLLTKHFNNNNLRYLGQETPTQANGVG